MTSYVRVSPEQVPVGTMALLLFIDHGELCAGVIEHLRDGRLDRRVPNPPGPDDVVPVICGLIAGQPETRDEVYVVIEQAAYWPDPFPTLKNYGSATDASNPGLDGKEG